MVLGQDGFHTSIQNALTWHQKMIQTGSIWKGFGKACEVSHKSQHLTPLLPWLCCPALCCRLGLKSRELRQPWKILPWLLRELSLRTLPAELRCPSVNTGEGKHCSYLYTIQRNWVGRGDAKNTRAEDNEVVAVFQSCCCLAGKTSGARKFPLQCITFTGSAVLPTSPWHSLRSRSPASSPRLRAERLRLCLLALMCGHSVGAIPKEASLESFVSSALSFVLAEISSLACLLIPRDPRNPYLKKIIFLFRH